MGSRQKAEAGKRLIVLFMVLVCAWEYSGWTVYGWAELANERPFVYRALVPWIAEGLCWLGLSYDLALRMVVTGCAIGLLYALIYFSDSIG